jgi:predicted ABC-type transport system involved in lysophospholipase L1 biosynthesis ATPase subunit
LLRLAFAQLRFRPGRSVALLVVLMATVACFALVGASAGTEQVTVHGTLEAAPVAGGQQQRVAIARALPVPLGDAPAANRA